MTGPVRKAALAAIGYDFPGQTEFFAAKWGGDPVMAFCGGKLRVVLATWHVPLYEVARLLGPHRLQRTVAAATTLARAEGITAPRIGVCGLNPHAGEGGLLGYEEKDLLDPALRGEFDVVVALYHDQGLAPLKVIDFDEAVNVTLGLPFVRTSPDHGTAFGIAGQGKASSRSFANAVTVARRLIKSRSGA